MKTMMQQLRWGTAVIPAALILAACGGGGGGSSSSSPPPPPPPVAMVSVTGVVASGNAEIGSVVTLIDKNGLTASSAPTDSHGAYTIAAGAYVFPIALTANARAGTLVSLLAPASAPANGTTATVNVTTLTTALAALLTNGNPTDTTTLRRVTPTQVATAITILDGALQNVLSANGVPATLNPITDSLTANGTGADAVINAVEIVPSANGPTLILAPTLPDQPATPGIPLIAATVTTPPAPLPVPPPSNVPPSATAGYLDYLQKALQDCAALPLAQRASSARCGDIVDPGFLQNGYTSLDTLVPDLGADLSVGATFSLPKTLFFRTINNQNQSIVRVYYTLNDGTQASLVSVAQELATPRMLSDGTSVAWDLIGNQSLFDATINSRVQRNVALDNAPGDINIYLSGLVITFNPDGPNPAAASVNSVRVTGPGLPTGGVWLRRSLECNGGTTMHLMGTPPVSPPLSTAGIQSTTSFFKWDWQTVTPGQSFTPSGPGIWAVTPVDVTTIPQYATYIFTLYDATGAQVGSFGRPNLAPPTAAAAGAALAWNSLDPGFIASFLTPGGTQAAEQSSATPSWSRNASALPIQSVYVGGTESTTNSFVASSGISHVAPNANPVAVTAPSTAANGIATTCNGTFPPLQVAGDQRYVQLRLRDANGLQVVDQSLVNYTTPASHNALLSGGYVGAVWSFAPSGAQPITPAVGQPLALPLGFVDEALTLSLDGLGAYTGNATADIDFVQAAIAVSGAYLVSNSGTAYPLTYTPTASTVRTGAVMADGSIGIATNLTSASQPEISVFAKSATGFTNASLSGNYMLVSFYFDPTTEPNMVTAGTPMPVPLGFHSEISPLSADGAGNATSSGGSNNRDGTALPPDPPLMTTYTVADNGAITLAGAPNLHLTLAAGGQVIVGANVAGAPEEIAFGVKKGSGMSVASLSGTYALAIYTFNSQGSPQPLAPASGTPAPAPLGFSSALLTIVCDGAGNVTIPAGTINNDGVIATATQPPATYTVAADGTLLTNNNQEGAVSADGKVFVLGSTSGNPWFGIGIKQ